MSYGLSSIAVTCPSDGQLLWFGLLDLWPWLNQLATLSSINIFQTWPFYTDSYQISHCVWLKGCSSAVILKLIFLLYLHVNLRSNNISLNWTGCSSQTFTEESRCRERAAFALISRHRGNTNNHRDSLKFVQEVARCVTSRFFWRKKVAMQVWKGVISSNKVAKLATLLASLLLISLSLSDCSNTRIFKRTHTYRNIWTMANQRGGRSALHYHWLV